MEEKYKFDDTKYYATEHKFQWADITKMNYKPANIGQLSVRIISGDDLVAMDSNGLSDPYVKIHLPVPQDKLKSKSYDECQGVTSVQSATLSPKWNETFKLTIEIVESDLLLLEVWDKDTIGSDDFLGLVAIDLSFLPHNVEVVTDENLSYTTKGRIKIGLKALNFGWTDYDDDYIDKYKQWRSDLSISNKYSIKKEEELVKGMDQYSKNRTQGPLVGHGSPKRLYHKYSIVNGWVKKEKSSSEKIANNLKETGLIMAAFAAVLADIGMDATNQPWYRKL